MQIREELKIEELKDEEKTFECKKICNQMKTCKRHKCKRVCCDVKKGMSDPDGHHICL
jgi:hypothetical protein